MTETVIGVPAALETSLTTIYAASNPCFLLEVNVCADVSDCTWTLHVVGEGETPDFSNRVFNAETLAANSRLPYSCTIALNAGDEVKASSSVADNVGMRLTIVEFAP